MMTFIDIAELTQEQSTPILKRRYHCGKTQVDNRQKLGTETAMGHALKKTDRIYIPPRDKSQVAVARPAEGEYKAQLEKAFCAAFQRYEKALEELAKV